MEKAKKTIGCFEAVIVIIIFTVLGFVSGYAIKKVNKIDCPKSIVNINEVVDKVESGSALNDFEIEKKDDNYVIVEKKEKNFYDVEDLNVEAFDNYPVFNDISDNSNVVETVYNGNDYSAMLDITGRVIIKNYMKDKSVIGELNIDRVVDIIVFSVPADYSEQLLYLLTEDGNVYSYKFGNSDVKNYEVIRVEGLSNVKKIFISNYSKNNAGGASALFAITGDNDCLMIDGSSV